MKHLIEFLSEGLLDIGSLEASVDKTIADEWAKENLRGKYTLRRLKNGNFKAYGNLILRGYDGDDFGGIVIDSLDGSLYIEDCPNLKSLDGVFAQTPLGDISAKVTGDIKITNCKAFNSLRGLPDYIDGEFVCVDCPSLKSLEGAPAMVGDVTIVKAGKKFNKQQIQNHFKCAVRIMCSQEEYENMITEALSEPHLLAFWDWVKKTNPKAQAKMDELSRANPYLNDSKVKKITFADISDKIRWDQVRPSDVTVYDNQKDKVKDIRKDLLSVANGKAIAIIQRFTEDWEYEWVMAGNTFKVYGINLIRWSNGLIDEYRQNTTFNKMELLNFAGTAAGEPNKTRRFIIIKIDPDEQGARHVIHNKRIGARRGMVENTPEYYKKVAETNRKRWKELMAKAKAMGVSNEYLAVAQKFEPLIHRYAKLPEKLKDPVWTQNYQYGSKWNRINYLITNMQTNLLKMMNHVYNASGQTTNNSIFYTKEESLQQAERTKIEVMNSLRELDNLLSEIGL